MKTIATGWPAIRQLVILVVFISEVNSSKAQIRWDGEALDGLWTSAANWVGNVVPSLANDVLLDNSVITGHYVVIFPSGGLSIVVRSLVIQPSPGNSIQVILPSSNTAVPGFTATGAVYGLQIHSGGVFTNSSGASAGSAVDISDSIKILDGGVYKHNTSRAHANNVMVLSRAPGTEQGTFEFDVPGGAGYTISIAGRVYGNMVLSSTAAGGLKSYTSTGTAPVQLNGDFRINAGASYSLNSNGNFTILGDFIHHGNVFDVSSGTNSNVLVVKKNFVHSGMITESGTGTPAIELGGNTTQDIFSSGNLTGSLILRINNAAGVRLIHPLQIQYRLQLVNGPVRSSSANVLIFSDNATCIGGSVNSFVEGTVRKLGDDNFEFPTGRQGEYAPISISAGGSISDAFEAEYFLGNPSTTFGFAFEDPPIVRVSSLEYWRLERLSGLSQKKVTVSVRTYSDATLLEKLVVARWDALSGIWKNEGNTAFSGIASGIITSQDVNSFSVFTVGSTVITQNPLPLSLLGFSVEYRNSVANLQWKVDKSLDASSFEVFRSGGTNFFEKIGNVQAQAGKLDYNFQVSQISEGNQYYQIKMVGKNGKEYRSVVRALFVPRGKNEVTISSPGMLYGEIHLVLETAKNRHVEILVLNVDGKQVGRFSVNAIPGKNRIKLYATRLVPGVYFLVGIAGNTKTNTLRIVHF